MSPFGFDTTSDVVGREFSDRIAGRVFLITGTSDGGLGAHAVVELARHEPAKLILVSRTKAKTEPVMAKIKAINANIIIQFIQCELSDFDSVRQAAREINDTNPKIDVVLNNAGVMAIGDFTKDKQGHELQLSSNHLGHFLLTNLVLPRIIAAGPGARIVNVSSDGHLISFFHFDDWNFSNGKTYNDLVAYGQSKTANILFSVALAQKLASRGIIVLAAHPGVVSTNLTKHVTVDDFGERIPQVALKTHGVQTTNVEPRAKSISEGVAPLLAAALDPAFDAASGSYIKDCQVVQTWKFAHDPELAQRLWELSEELVGEKFEW